MRIARLAAGLVQAALFVMPLLAHDIITTNLTYTRDISRIFERRCISCHGDKSSVPLTNYENARPWAVDIKEQVLSRAMPPWGAVKGFGDLQPDHALTQEEILIIAAWVVGGAPKGDPSFLPKPGSIAPMPAMPTIPLRDVLTVTTRAVLNQKIELAAIKPLGTATVPSARVIARLPDGRIQPLVWLYHYDPRAGHSFRFREQLALPEKTIILSDTPLLFALQTTASKSSAR